uniref:DDE-1 domain-containing protein n=1 Tax=Trichuris muris TaxID=70415 RepID=A0A5S6QKD5_TRIMR
MSNGSANTGTKNQTSKDTASVPQYSIPTAQPQSKYNQLLAVIEELGKDIRPTYSGNKMSAERLKRSIIHARILVRECILETERAAGRGWTRKLRFIFFFEQSVFNGKKSVKNNSTLDEKSIYSRGEMIGKTGKVLLLIGNAVPDLLNSVDELVTIKFFPPNVTSLIQPMDQDVIRSFKSWESVKHTTLRKSWNRVLGKSASGVDDGRDDGVEMEEIARMLRIISISGECENSQVERWLGCDSDDQDFQMMKDEEIVEFVSYKADTEEDKEEQGEEKAGPSTIPSNNAALQHIEQALRWYEAQEECDRHRLFCLKCVSDLAAQKCEITLKQMRITEFLDKN